jgi:hypothetical protein
MDKKFSEIKRNLFNEFGDVNIPSCFHLHGVLTSGLQRLLEIATRQEDGQSVKPQIQYWLAGLSALADHAAIVLGVADEKEFSLNQEEIDKQQIIDNLNDAVCTLEKYIDTNEMIIQNPNQPLSTINVVRLGTNYVDIMQDINDLLEDLS